jgi:ubiquitin-protein ligase E3 D
MSSLKPLMYAELLSNIRQVSVIVALQEPCDLTTKVELSTDGRRFILRHGHSEEASSLSLPGQVSPSFQLQRPVFGVKELTWRLPLTGEPTCTSMDTMQSNCAPWSAKYLGKETEFVCRACGSEIVKKGSIGTWRDLPSENWAEMMDFWHCHKPEVPDGHVEQSAANRGYGANTKFTPTPGIGFVDLTSFLLADADCQNTQVRDTFSFESWVCGKEHSEGIKKVARLASAVQWLGHRYKYPKSTPCHHSAQQQSFMPTPFSRLWVYMFDWRLRPRHFTLYLPRDLGSHRISTRDIF